MADSLGDSEEARAMPIITPNKPLSAGGTWGGWGKMTSVSPCSLEEVMSEELGRQLQSEELVSFRDELDNSLSPIGRTSSVGEDTYGFSNDGANVDPGGGADTSSDLLIAQMLQLEMDTEHDRQLRREEDKWNGTSKVKVTYDQYRTVHPALRVEMDSADYDIEVQEAKLAKDTTPCFNGRGISGKGKNIVTKHDADICSKKNVTRVMETFPPGFETGDDTSFDMRLPNHVFNQLKIHSNVDNKRGHRLHEKKEHSTAELAVDAKTRLIMYKLVNSGVLHEINGVVSTGKESVVFHAYGGSLPNEMVPRECALKVFKTTLAEFKTRCQYVRGDVRFFKDEFKKQNPRKIMRIWAEKEEINLRRMQKFGIPCPMPVLLKKHVLVMSFIGENQNAAPTLKDAKLSEEELKTAYQECVQHIKTMYKSCQLVHADLSEYNILWLDAHVHLIDVAQAVDSMHPHAMHFLLRDCSNMSEFFLKRGVEGVSSAYELFNEVTGLALEGQGSDFLSAIEKYEKDERCLQLGLTKTDYPFDFFFAKACAERENAKTGNLNESTGCELNSSEDDEDDSDNDENEEGEEKVDDLQGCEITERTNFE